LAKPDTHTSETPKNANNKAAASVDARGAVRTCGVACEIDIAVATLSPSLWFHQGWLSRRAPLGHDWPPQARVKVTPSDQIFANSNDSTAILTRKCEPRLFTDALEYALDRVAGALDGVAYLLGDIAA